MGVLAASGGVAVRDLAECLATAMRAMGAEVAVLGAEAVDASASWLHALETEHDFILMAAERNDVAFAAYAARRHCQRYFLLGAAR